MAPPRKRRPHGFTLVEILVVILIIVLVSATTLPIVLPALSHRELGDSARLLQATLAGTRDLAIRANSPRGLRFLPDEQFNGATAATPLASSRMIGIEPAPDHNEGFLLFDPGAVLSPPEPAPLMGDPPKLRVFELKWADYGINNPPVIPNPPTSWYWNIRQGDKLRIGNSGPYYTIVGPMLRNNPERFINVGDPHPNNTGPTAPAEFLWLTNGRDDDDDGYVDEGFDGIDNDGDGITDPGFNGVNDDPTANPARGIDDPTEMLISRDPSNNQNFSYVGLEYEKEEFVSPEISTAVKYPLSYRIIRRPIPSPGAREVALSPGVVIDMTTLNLSGTPERSRLPLDPATLTVDLMFYPNGLVLPSSPFGSAVSPFGNNSALGALPPFYHFWLAERGDLYAPGTTSPRLPMPQGALNYQGTTYLKGEARLITIVPRTGQLLTNTISEASFNASKLNLPYQAAQEGKRNTP